MFKKDWPKIHAAWASVSLKSYETYVKTISKVLAEEVKRIEREAKKELKKLKDVAKFEREQEYNLHIMDLKQSFPAMCYETTFVAIYSRLEHELVSWCHKIQEIRKYKLAVEDMKSQGIIDQCRRYMIKAADMPFPEGAAWNDVVSLQKIRNKIVHGRGQLLKRGQTEDKETKQLRKFIADKGGKTSLSGNIRLTEPFCLNSVAIVRGFIKKLADVTPDT